MEWKSDKLVLQVLLLFVIYGKVYTAKSLQCPKECVDCSCKEVNYQNISLTTIPDIHIKGITGLYLDHNKLTDIPIKLSKLATLETLSVSHNHIKRLDKAHLNISSLQTLDVSYNNLIWSQIQPDALNLTKSILTLDLSGNSLRQFNAKSFLRSKSLETLKMKNCSIDYIPRLLLSELSILKTFDLSENNRLRDLGFVNSSVLEVLNATNCGLETVNLLNFPNLRDAYFKGNRISIIRSEYFKNDKLEYLDLTDNGIKFINHNAFESLPELKYISLSMNVFNDLHPNTFIKNMKLETLVISHTYLKNLVQFKIPSLLTLDLSINEIQYFTDESLITMPSLQHLNLYRNLISRLPNTIMSHSLLYLNLSTCQITTVTENTFNTLMNLRSLDLSNNRLTSIKPNYFPKSLHNVKLYNNLWRCECYSKEFKEQHDALVQPYELASSRSLICHSPENVSGLTWDEACGPVWYNMNNNMLRQGKTWMYIISLVLSMSVIFCATMCIRRMHQVKVMREQTERLQQRMEAQERINRLRREQLREREAQQNAPDPRELQRPPSYHEAIRMPRIDGSYSSLAGSRASITASRLSMRATSRTSLAASNPDLSKARSRSRSRDLDHDESKSSNSRPRRSRTPKAGRRRRRRRSRVENSGEFDTQSVPDLATDEDVTRSMMDSGRSEVGDSEAVTDNDNNNNQDP